ncbi:sugar phosphate isomerase/epimerase family protein [Dyadobacter sediminis]|uniref:Sugar phosphate isomerase/epimerase n=1 Tax=Dyadobacter sediminis TaxID=1493691 RepID=A0A5R9K7G1_9BACT|nr:sugar phosphate isomerase/epimerase [Dyadobacter sediminis]TLU89794.1 sugar phosphate isomerase/epimerase [Dyadobacter sediminis]GGC12769.1 sugar phosphate isomerase [Dyadobacter sediminis]
MENNRRHFIKKAGALLAGGMALPYLSEGNVLNELFMAKRPVGIQLFTVFEKMNENPKETLEQIAKIGYKEIESAFSMREGYYGYKPKEFKSLLEGMGLKWRAHHAIGAPFKIPAGAKLPTGSNGKPFSIPPTLNLRDNYQQLVDNAAEGGLSYLVCASTPVGTMDEIKNSIEVFQKTGEACKKAGIGFAYHNHATEFDPVDGGKTPYELVLSQTDKDLVKMELDLAWATKAGKDPVALFKEHPGRFPLWHVKDIKKDLQTVTEVGNGVVEFKRIFEAAQIAGLQNFFVEYDLAPSMETVRTCYQNLIKMEV